MGEAIKRANDKLTQKLVLLDPYLESEFIVQRDASYIEIGVILAQSKNREERSILHRKFTAPEKDYSATERECEAINIVIKKLNQYQHGQKFKIKTDHNFLISLKTSA